MGCGNSALEKFSWFRGKSTDLTQRLGRPQSSFVQDHDLDVRVLQVLLHHVVNDEPGEDVT